MGKARLLSSAVFHKHRAGRETTGGGPRCSPGPDPRHCSGLGLRGQQRPEGPAWKFSPASPKALPGTGGRWMGRRLGSPPSAALRCCPPGGTAEGLRRSPLAPAAIPRPPGPPRTAHAPPGLTPLACRRSRDPPRGRRRRQRWRPPGTGGS